MRAATRPRFLLDLAEELSWLNEKAGAETAERWYDALEATIEFVQQHPFIGRERRDLKPSGIRTWRIKGFARWLIFYGVSKENRVVFYRIRSATMNLVVLKM